MRKNKKIDHRSSRVADQIRKGYNGDWFDLAEYMMDKFEDCDWFKIRPIEAWMFTKTGEYGVWVNNPNSGWSHFRTFVLGKV